MLVGLVLKLCGMFLWGIRVRLVMLFRLRIVWFLLVVLSIVRWNVGISGVLCLSVVMLWWWKLVIVVILVSLVMWLVLFSC